MARTRVRVCVRVCVCACVRACVRACVLFGFVVVVCCLLLLVCWFLLGGGGAYCGNRSGKRAHKQLVRKRSSTVLSANGSGHCGMNPSTKRV